MSNYYIAIDNGVTGTIAILTNDGKSDFFKTPAFKQKNYTKAKGDISRINFRELLQTLKIYEIYKPLVIIERPMVNPGRFKATISALRALEATQIAVEYLKYPYEFIDSKQWQREFFPPATKEKKHTSLDLKRFSVEYGLRYFPEHEKLINKHKDADSLLMARWAMLNNR